MSSLPLVHKLAAAPDPAEAASRFSGLPHLILLESAAPASSASRYSYLAADPSYVVRSRNRRTTRSLPLRSELLEIESDPLQAVYDLLSPYAHDAVPGLPPFQGGAAGFLGYELGNSFERVPRTRDGGPETPDACIGIYDWVVAWDHAERKAWIISTGMPDVGAARDRRAAERMRFVQAALQDSVNPKDLIARAATRPGPPTFPVPDGPDWLRSTFSRPAYEAAVARVVEYILAGDVFQVNLSQRFEGPRPPDPFTFYRRLREQSPAPFAALLIFDDFAIASASPERFLHFDPITRLVETRPIKGTRPRSTDPVADLRLRAELEGSEKDRAENVMIVDLLRNDLSRVCDPGTVEVPSLLAVESHPTVHHLVSTVVGRLTAGRTWADLLRATFPGGSITGAPKIRAMEIIAELEPTSRGPYTGAIGYWSLTGSMDTSIAIRTCVLSGEKAWFPAGGGIVADSSPAAEYQETLDKARAIIAALSPP
ncbi:MAG: aminodeoxychorismate synthase component I [Gemmatimonadota bacterium]